MLAQTNFHINFLSENVNVIISEIWDCVSFFHSIFVQQEWQFINLLSRTSVFMPTFLFSIWAVIYAVLIASTVLPSCNLNVEALLLFVTRLSSADNVSIWLLNHIFLQTVLEHPLKHDLKFLQQIYWSDLLI